MGTTNNWQRGIRRKGLGKKENGEEIGERRDLFLCLSRFSPPPLPFFYASQATKILKTTC